MKDLMIFLVFTVNLALPAILQYECTGVTSGSGTSLTEFTLVGRLDGEQFVYYDSNIMKMIPQTDWMKKAENQHYWDTNTGWAVSRQGNLEASLNEEKSSSKVTKGKTVKAVFGCELHSGTEKAFARYTYDGEEFLRLEMINSTWTTDKISASKIKDYLQNNCPPNLRKYASYDKSISKSTGLPKVSVVGMNCSSTLVCNTTGFYSKAAVISWRKDGVDLGEAVQYKEVNPSHEDGTFQKWSILNVSCEDLQRNVYSCAVQYDGLEMETVFNVSKVVQGQHSTCTVHYLPVINSQHTWKTRSVISEMSDSNENTFTMKQCSSDKKTGPSGTESAYIVVVAVLLVGIVICVLGFMWFRNRPGKTGSIPPETTVEDTGATTPLNI